VLVGVMLLAASLLRWSHRELHSEPVLTGFKAGVAS